jgi:hypothetical protein
VKTFLVAGLAAFAVAIPGGYAATVESGSHASASKKTLFHRWWTFDSPTSPGQTLFHRWWSVR